MDGFSELLILMWDHPTYRILAAVVTVEMTVIIAMMSTLWWQTIRWGRYEKKRRELADWFIAAAEADGDEDTERPRASKVLRDVLVDFGGTKYRKAANRLWRELDFSSKEYRLLTKRSTRQHLAAIRRLYVFADDRDADRVLEALQYEQDHRFRLMAAQLMAELDRGADVVEALRGVVVDRRTMEQPFYAIFHTLSIAQIELLTNHDLSGLSERAQHILLEIAAEHGIDSVADQLDALAHSEELENRLASARICAVLNNDKGRQILRALLSDDDWQVRAQAARGLGTNGGLRDVSLLREAAGDAQFWVRENVAWALEQHAADDHRPSHGATETDKEVAGIANSRLEDATHIA